MDARLIRCLLFVPGDRSDRFAKAERSGADGVVFDLEDAVAPDRKREALNQVMQHLQSRTLEPAAIARVVRLNNVVTQQGADDLTALCASTSAVDFVMLPKVEDPAAVQLAARRIGGRSQHPGLIALIESARGLENAAAIANSSPALAALAFGGADLSADLGAAMAWEPLLYARGRVVAAAALSGLAVLDVPWLEIKDKDGLMRECVAARRMGFTGKIAIHPAQVSVVVRAFSPSVDEVARARRVVDASDAAQGGVAMVDGRMIDAPVVTAARRILALGTRTAGEGARK